MGIFVFTRRENEMSYMFAVSVLVDPKTASWGPKRLGVGRYAFDVGALSFRLEWLKFDWHE